MRTLTLAVLLTAVQPAIGGPAVVATRLDGSTAEGELTSWSEGHITLTSPAGDQQLPLEQLLSLSTQAGSEPPSTAATTVELVDGSELPLVNYSASQAMARLEFAAGLSSPAMPAEVPLEHVAAALFQQLDADRLVQWEEIRASQPPSDVLVVARGDDAGLDYLEGVLRNVSATHVEFELDGEPVPVKRARIAGLLYLRKPFDTDNTVRVRLRGTGQLVARVNNIRWENDTFVVTTATGLTVSVLPHVVDQIDFSAGRLVYLSDLEPARNDWKPAVALPETAELARQAGLPQRDRGMYGGPLKLEFPVNSPDEKRARRETYAKGLSLRSGTEIVYRVPGNHGRFAAVVGIDPDHLALGNVSLSFLTDDRVLFETELDGTTAPVPIESTSAEQRR